jgi:predicted PolB exonuclease-like 3'-5' exonuclease
MIYVVFDLETVGREPTQEEENAFLDNWTPPSNWKAARNDEEKCAAKRKQDFDKWKKNFNFEVGKSKVISAAFAEIKHDKTLGEVEVCCGKEEAKVAKFAAKWLNDLCSPIKLVGYNSSSFDLPHLATLLANNGQALTHPLGKWDSVDLFFHPLGRKGSLNDWCAAFNIHPEDPDMNGSKVGELYQQGELEKIASYNADDVRMTGELFLKLSKVYQL